MGANKPNAVLLGVCAVVFMALFYRSSNNWVTTNTAAEQLAAGHQQLVDHVDQLQATVDKLTREVATLRKVSLRVGRVSQSSSAAAAVAGQPVVAAAQGDVDTSPSMTMFGAAPKNRPSSVVEKTSAHDFYDGATNAKHLGGSTANDTMGQSPALYTHLVKNINVRSVVDIGCGRGISTRWFYDHGVDALCIEGAHDAITKSYMPQDRIIEHDFSLGPYWPEKTYDLAWSVELLEHIGRQYMKNYFPILHKAAMIWVTHANTGGHHHVEVHPDIWWINRFELQGFVHSPSLTKVFRKVAQDSKGDGFNAQHLWTSGLAFLNPKVASRPEHQHLMGDPGCFTQSDRSFPCGTKNGQGRTVADTLPTRFQPAFRTPTKWDDDLAKAYVLEGAVCNRSYPFPTWHDGC